MRAIGLILRAVAGPRARTLCTGGGIAGATLLVLTLLAAHRSLTVAAITYIGQPGVDLWIAPFGTDNVVRSSGFLAEAAPDSIRLVPGVAAADPLVRGFVTAERRNAGGGAIGAPLTLLGIASLPDRKGGVPPTALWAGRAPSRRGEVALDRAAAFRLGSGIGDTILANGRDFRIVGLTAGTNLLATQFAFFELTSARRSLDLPDRASFIAVSLSPGTDPATVAAAIEDRFPEMTAFQGDRFLANNVREVSAGVIPLIVVIGALGVAVASILVLLLVQGMVEEQRPELATLTALGAGREIAAALVLRSATLASSGVIAGSALAVGLTALLDRFLPTISLTTVPSDVVRAGTVFVGAAVGAALIPIARLRQIDPLEAFRQ